jgi:hypothetical protein
MALARLLLAAAFAVCVVPAWALNDEEELERNKADAIDRVVESHDFSLIMGAGRVFIRQAAIRSARGLLAEWGQAAGLDSTWNESAGQWQAAERALLEEAGAITERRFENPGWIREAWQSYTSELLSGEEADHIATHFTTEGGRRQRQLMDWFLGETVLFIYTYTDRIQYNLAGSEEDMRRLQRIAQQRIPAEDVEFASRFADTLNFIGRDPGLKYWKMLGIPLVGEIVRHIDGVAREIENDLRLRRAVAQPHIDAFRRGS